MPEWVAAANDIIGIPLTIAGFIFAIVQIYKTKNSANAAKTAASDAVSSISSNYLLILLPQLNRVESELDTAVDQDDRRLAAAHMSQWRWQAGQVRGWLSGDDPSSKKVAKLIQTSITLAATAKLDALDKAQDLPSVARPVQEAIAAVTGELGQLSSRQTREIKA
jgi:hypothetical protein